MRNILAALHSTNMVEWLVITNIFSILHYAFVEPYRSETITNIVHSVHDKQTIEIDIICYIYERVQNKIHICTKPSEIIASASLGFHFDKVKNSFHITLFIFVTIKGDSCAYSLITNVMALI